jgi:CMP-N-acetylneuraminic acid synthetase
VLTLELPQDLGMSSTDPVRMNPQVIAIIPARGGSKGVPGKNLRRVGGRSLVERAVDACRAAQLVHTVYVSTDDVEIAARAEAAGAKVIMRPVELASDTASSESALLHALDQLLMVGEEPEVLVFVQCTSPFIAPDDLDRGIELIIHDHADSVFSGVATYDFLWRADGRFGLVTGHNHDPACGPVARNGNRTSVRPARSMSCRQQDSGQHGIVSLGVRRSCRCPS